MSERLKTSFSPSLVNSDGFFSGYGAIFGNIDSHRDVIERGAFAGSLRAWQAKGKLPAMRLQHGSAGNPFSHDDLPIGKWTLMREDAKGLWVEGKLLALDTDQGKRIHALLAASVLDGLSIGFVPKKTRSGSGRVRRYLIDVDLREISIVDEPSNDLARIAAISPSDQAFDKLRDALTNTAQKCADPETAYDKLIAALRAAT